MPTPRPLSADCSAIACRAMDERPPGRDLPHGRRRGARHPRPRRRRLAWLKGPERTRQHHLAAAAAIRPGTQSIENVWAYLRANRLAISVLETYDNSVAQCCDAWNFFANDIATVRSITSREYAKAVKS